MSAAQEPVIPQGATPEQQRLGTNLRELMRALFNSGAFLLRSTLGGILAPRDGGALALRWGDMNRVLLTASATMQLPRIEPRWIGVPLHLVKLSSIGTLTLVPSGLGLSRRAPTVNEAASVAVGDPGLYTFVTDGQNWFAGKAVP